MPGGDGFCKNVFWVHNSSSAHADNRKKDILILGKGPVDGVDDAAIQPRVNNLSILLNSKKKCKFPYNGSESVLFVNAEKI